MGESKDVQIGVRLKPKENERVEKLSAEIGFNKPELMRFAVVNMSHPIWTVCKKFRPEELEKKIVKFRFSLASSVLNGEGTFFVVPHRDGPPKLAIEIRSTERVSATPIRFFLPQQLVDRIERSPDHTQSDFLCLA